MKPLITTNARSRRGGMNIMTHAVIGYPTRKETIKTCQNLEQGGADFLELQIPFSDPLADGPVIMSACQTALEQGMTVDACFDTIKRIREAVSIPIACMAYFQTVFAYGIEKFSKKIHQVGVEYLIVPDVTIDEDDFGVLESSCKKSKIALVYVISPNMTKERLQQILPHCSGFIYCTSRSGMTGTHATLDPKLEKCLELVRSVSDLPIAVGFGISKSIHIEALIGHADIAVVGSALIEQIEKHGIESVKEFVTSLSKEATKESI